MFRYTTSMIVSGTIVMLFALSNIFHVDLTHARGGPHSRSMSAPASLVINEVDSDTPGTDLAEFIELYDGGMGNTPLDGYVVVFFNGGAANDASYASFDLDGFSTNSIGYFTLGNGGVPGVDLTFANGVLQNGPDAVAIFTASAVDFPNGTPITTANIHDAVVYNNGATLDPGLLILLNAGQTQLNENAAGNGATVSLQRLPNGSGGTRNTSTYQVLIPTPDRANAAPTAAAMTLSGRIADFSGRGIRNAVVILEGGAVLRTTATGSMGYYNFDGVDAGTYTVTVNSRRHPFAMPSRTITMVDNVTGFDFTAEPQE